jgi:hypothetical protein
MSLDDGQAADFVTLSSLHNERQGDGLLCGASSGAEGYGIGSSGCADGPAHCRAPSRTSAPGLPPYATEEKKRKCIAQAQSTLGDTQSEESKHEGRDK